MIETGFQRLIFMLPSEGEETIPPLLDRYAKLMESFG